MPFGDPYWYSGLKSPYYKESHFKLRAAIRTFVDKEIMPFCHEWDEAKQLPRSLYGKLAEQNLLAAVIGAPFTGDYHDRRPIMGIVPVEEYDFFHWLVLYGNLKTFY